MSDTPRTDKVCDARLEREYNQLRRHADAMAELLDEFSKAAAAASFEDSRVRYVEVRIGPRDRDHAAAAVSAYRKDFPAA